MVVQVQAIHFASLAASLFFTFLAMLGKQWLNRYASVDMRGSTIERSRNRQRKLNGIVSWYFDHVMGSLPLMLQATLSLLGCAPRYLWEINRTCIACPNPNLQKRTNSASNTPSTSTVNTPFAVNTENLSGISPS